jgi:AcrR family transcriptional regulator
MAKPRSEEKRSAIMAAAVRVIAAQGLGAPTATIAQEAGVANGSLFTYFETKADLFNQLYLELKSELASVSLKGLPVTADLRKQMLHAWSRSMDWAVSNPEKRRALAQLGVSDEITPASREAGHKTMAGIAALLERSRAGGPMRQRSDGFYRRDHERDGGRDDGFHDPRSNPREKALQGRVRCPLAHARLIFFIES